MKSWPFHDLEPNLSVVLWSRRCVMEWIYPAFKFPWMLSLSVVVWLQIISLFLLILQDQNFSGCVSEYSTALVLIGFLFPAWERMISEVLLECSCLHIDYLSSLGALSLTFEKANSIKPVFIFSFVRSWVFLCLLNSTKGYIISFIFLN